MWEIVKKKTGRNSWREEHVPPHDVTASQGTFMSRCATKCTDQTAVCMKVSPAHQEGQTKKGLERRVYTRTKKKFSINPYKYENESVA